MPYLDVPIRVAADLPAPGQYNTGNSRDNHGAKWGNADLPSSLDVVISRSRLLPGPCTYGWYSGVSPKPWLLIQQWLCFFVVYSGLFDAASVETTAVSCDV
jgi:hypothetical protein